MDAVGLCVAAGPRASAFTGTAGVVLKMMIFCSGKSSGLKKRWMSRLCRFIREFGVPSDRTRVYVLSLRC